MSGAAAIAAGILLLLLPGGALAAAMGLRGLRLVALAAPFSIAMIGSVGVIDAAIGVGFAWWHAPVLGVVVAAAIAVARRRGARLPRSPFSRLDVGPVVAVAVASIAVTGIGLAAIGSLDRISQSYDGVFHLSAIAWILEHGDASSFHLYRITHPGEGNEFYPAAWHAVAASLVQITGVGVPAAANATWAATTATIWMPGVALLAAECLRGRSRRRAAVIAPLAAVGAGGFPLLLLSWGTLYPTGLAYALLPAGLAIAVRIARRVVLRLRRRLRPDPVLLVSALLWLIASMFAHPRSLFSLAALLAPLAIGTAAVVLRRLWRRPALRRRIALVVGGGAALLVAIGVAGALYVYRAFDVGSRPISDHLNGGPATARQGLLDSLGQALALSPLDPNRDTVALAPAIGLAVLAIVGAVVALRRPGLRWMPISWLVAVLLWTLAAGSNSDLAKVATGLWYKDKFRLFPLVALMAVLLAVVALTAIADIVLARSRVGSAPRRAASVLGAALVLAVATAGAQLPEMAGSVQVVFRMPAHDKAGAILDRDEYRLLSRLDDTVPEGEVVAGNPWNGALLSGALGGREPLFPHLTGVWSPDEIVVANSLADAASDPAVCAAVDRLGLRWVVADPELLWGAPADAAFYAGIDRAVTTPGVLERVDREGSAGLYRITACD